MTYHVDVEREDGQWIGEVRGVTGAHTFAGSLQTLEQYLREVIALALDLPDEDGIVLELHFADPLFAEAAAHVEQAQHFLQEAQLLFVQSVGRLADAGESTRDIAVVTKHSVGWVSKVAKVAGDVQLVEA